MAEDDGDKTEAPTPRRREQAREQGNIARSPDITAAALLVGSMVMLHNYGGAMVAALRDLMRDMLGAASLSDFTTTGLLAGVTRSARAIGSALGPLLAGAVIIAIACNVVQVGIGLHPSRVQPNLAALNPFRGLGRIFGGRNTVQSLLSLVKFMLLSVVAYSAVAGKIQQIILVQQLSFGQIFLLSGTLVYTIAIRVGITLLILAILEYVYQRFRIERELKMTKQEVKEEMRSMEGDPKIKSRRRQIAMQLATQKLKKDVPTADVVVTNPTEFAVALKYDAATMHAPRVIAKGQGTMAARIRQIAVENGIPILERKPLARALFKLVEVGQEIPEQFYSTVAEILAYVYELNGKAARRAG